MLQLKLRYFFLPYLLATLLVAAGYAAFYYMAVLQWHIVQPQSEALDVWYPIVAAMVPAMFLIGRFTRLDWRISSVGALSMIAVIVGIMWPVLGLHNYLTTPGNISVLPGGQLRLLWNNDAWWAVAPFVFCPLANLLLILASSIDREEVERKQQETIRTKINNTFKELRDYIPRGDYFSAILLTNIFIVVFVVTTFRNMFGFRGVNGYTLIGWGANYTPLTIMNQWWRLVTNLFLHDNPYHLLLDLGLIYVASWYMERPLGRVRFIVFFLLCGVSGSFAHVAFSQGVGYGATGGIFGLLGMCVALILRGKVHFKEGSTMTRKSMLSGILIPTVIVLVLGYFCGYPLAGPVGGFISGILLGPAINADIDAEIWVDEDW